MGMRQPRAASKSVKLQRPDEGHRVQSLLRNEDMAAGIVSPEHRGRLVQHEIGGSVYGRELDRL
jgi:hypothetical protein